MAAAWFRRPILDNHFQLQVADPSHPAWPPAMVHSSGPGKWQSVKISGVMLAKPKGHHPNKQHFECWSELALEITRGKEKKIIISLNPVLSIMDTSPTPTLLSLVDIVSQTQLFGVPIVMFLSFLPWPFSLEGRKTPFSSSRLNREVWLSRSRLAMVRGGEGGVRRSGPHMEISPSTHSPESQGCLWDFILWMSFAWSHDCGLL